MLRYSVQYRTMLLPVVNVLRSTYSASMTRHSPTDPTGTSSTSNLRDFAFLIQTVLTPEEFYVSHSFILVHMPSSSGEHFCSYGLAVVSDLNCGPSNCFVWLWLRNSKGLAKLDA